MKMKNWIKAMFAASVLCLAACSDDPDVAPIKRDTDEINVAYQTGATARFTVRFNGAWEVRAVCTDPAGNPEQSWFTLTPDSGVGNGTDYQYVTVTASRNAGAARKGMVVLVPRVGAEQTIAITQEDGTFSVLEPEISGTLRSGASSSAMLVVGYDKAFGGEKLLVKTTLSGAGADGLGVVESYETTIEEEGSGSVSIPIEGAPAFLGELVCNLVVTVDDREVFNGAVSTSVVSDSELFRMEFERFLWGGDYVANKAGISPVPGGGEAPASYDGSEPDAGGGTTAGTNGAKDMFSTMSDAYRANRGITEWTGQRCYERPGYIRLGTGTAGGWIMTPPLASLSSAPETVVLSVDLCRADNENGTFIVSAEEAGVVLNGNITAATLPAPAGASSRKWTTLSFTIEGATNRTRIKISAEDITVAGSRMNLDNLVVMGAAVTEVTEPLPEPDREKIAYTSTDASIRYTWEGVKGATGYEASIARQDAPDFRKTIRTDIAECLFEELTPGFYLFTLKALYAPNAEFDSGEVECLSGTSGFVTSKLDPPQGLECMAGVTSVKLTWDPVTGATGYEVVLRSTPSGVEVAKAEVTEPAHEFTELTAGTAYTVSVRALVAGNEAFNSEEATLSVETVTPTQLRKPAVTKVYQVGYAHAIVEYDYEDWVVSPADRIPLFAFRVTDAAGNTVGAYTHIENGLAQSGKNYSFNNNVGRIGSSVKYNNPRFYLGGLEPGKEYRAQVRVMARNIDEADSEWSEPVSFTTAPMPDRSGYLFYKDFDDFWWGSNMVTMACAPIPAAGASGLTTVDWNQPYYCAANPVSTFGNLTSMRHDNASYSLLLNKFMPEWGGEDGADFAAGTVNLVAGHLKFGTGSARGSLKLPALAALTGPTDIILEFDACPYYEPAGGSIGYFPTPNPGTPGIPDDCYVTVAGGAELITSVDGAACAAASEVQITSRDQGAMDPAIPQYQYTHHTVRVSGATSATRLIIQSKTTKGGGRMWLDNITIRRAE